MKPVVWLIGGTSESRNLIKFMAELDIILYVSVATDSSCNGRAYGFGCNAEFYYSK